MKNEIIINETSDISILEYMNNIGCNVASYCSGLAKCGKCRVKITSPKDIPVLQSEYEFFTESELNEGWRLACLHTVSRGMLITDYLEALDEDMAVENDIVISDCEPGFIPKNPVIALDLGTTTMAAALVDPDTKKVLRLASCINHQKRFGADIISRINAASANDSYMLMRLARKDIMDLTQTLMAAMPNTRYVVSGNTTMQHILMGYPCKNLGIYPYTPVDISLHTQENFTMLPGIGVYVGADIVSGIIACDMDISDELCLFIDIGTNGEMAIGNRYKILTASTAAGPAFEGGNISCGNAAVPGAICSLKINGRTALYNTIDNKPPKGLCGSGVLETVYELLNAGIIDSTGLLRDEYFENGFPITQSIYFNQNDIREVQLAKAAIKAGIDILLKEFHAEYSDIDRLYIAGGFGKHVNITKAGGIGLIPAELTQKSIAVGNTSLKGAVRFALDQDAFSERFINTAKNSEEILLSDIKEFSESYINSINF